MGTQQTDIQAEGRTLSSKNAARLKSAWLELGSVLIDAKVVDSDGLEQLEEQSGEEMPDVDDEEPIRAENAPPIVTVVASSFIDTVRSHTWIETLRKTLQIFGGCYERSYGQSDEALRYDGKLETQSREDWRQQLLADLQTLLQDFAATRPTNLPKPYRANVYASAEHAAIQAESFINKVKGQTWHQRIAITLQSFCFGFISLCGATSEQLERDGIDNLEGAIAELIDDLFTMLAEISLQAPEPVADGEYYDGGYFSLAAEEPEPADEKAIAAEATPPTTENKDTDFPELLKVALQCSTIPIQARFAAATNRRAFEGVLFRIDEPSEAVPAVGPGLPLFVPRDVAESVVHSCAGLPLDADRSLSRHCNEDIAGVIMSARIEGNDFIVTGYLYDWSRGDKVRDIAANQEELGMSMNAAATGEVVEVNGQSVYQIKTLQLLGANILFAEKATYQKTRVLAAEAEDCESSSLDDGDTAGDALDAIAAASQTQPAPNADLDRAYQSLTDLNLNLSRLVDQMSSLSFT